MHTVPNVEIEIPDWAEAPEWAHAYGYAEWGNDGEGYWAWVASEHSAGFHHMTNRQGHPLPYVPFPKVEDDWMQQAQYRAENGEW